MHRIGIISDTHGLLRREVLENMRGCEVILHGGDIDKPGLLEELNKIAPVYAVRGNNDGIWAKDLPETLSLDLYGVRFFLIHDKKMIYGDLTETDIVICGHSHRYEEKYSGGKLWLNPGSCGPGRFALPVTMAVLEIKPDGSYEVRKIEITPGNIRKAKFSGTGSEKTPENIRQAIKQVMRDTDRRITVEEIAKRNKISRELAEQICRLYLTHPGVDADGILGKMGL